jgi:hypothetical protein
VEARLLQEQKGLEKMKQRQLKKLGNMMQAC